MRIAHVNAFYCRKQPTCMPMYMLVWEVAMRFWPKVSFQETSTPTFTIVSAMERTTEALTMSVSE